MISLDTSIIVYAVNCDLPEHGAARGFIDELGQRDEAAIAELATSNVRDFRGFGFLPVWDPLRTDSGAEVPHS